MLRVIIADDQAMVRGALAALLSLEPDLEVVAEVPDGQAALDFLADDASAGNRVNIALLDVEMPGMDGLRACEEIRTRFPDTQVLMLTTFGRPGYVARALSAGATGFLVKDAPSQQLAESIRNAAAGHRVIDPALAVESLSVGLSPLTERESEVMKVLASGCTVEDAAAKVFLSAGTVRNHISSVMAKTGAKTRSEAVRIATENGWL